MPERSVATVPAVVVEVGTDGGTAMRMQGLSKRFYGTQALSDVTLTVGKGQVHALLGGNGSGKSTLIKILAGVHRANAGVIEVGDARLDAESITPDWAHRVGIAFIHQDLGLFESLTVAENMFAGRAYPTRRGRIDWTTMRRESAAVLDRLGVEISPRSVVAQLRSSDRTLVAVARAVRGREQLHSGVLVLDEPTARLAESEVDRVLAALRVYAAAGQSILYVSHRLTEVLRIADQVTVLRDGRVVDTRTATGLDEGELSRLTVGRGVASMTTREVRPAPSGPALDVTGLHGGPIDGIDIEVRAGEIIGLAGIVGAGRSTLLKMIYGAVPRQGGEVRVGGVLVPSARIGKSVQRGMGFVPEDRVAEGAFLELGVAENLTAGGLAKRVWTAVAPMQNEVSSVRRDLEGHGVRTQSDKTPMALLSGGNQQKVVLARWLREQPKVLLLDEPTQGVDVGARAELYEHIRAAATNGCGVLIASSDPDELLRLCDRILVLRSGRIAHEGSIHEIDHDWIADHVYGVTAERQEPQK